MTALIERPVAAVAQPPSGATRRLRRRLRARSFVVTGGLGAVAVLLFVITLSVGSYRVPLGDVVLSVLRLKENPAVDFVVNGLRMPTALTALFVGLALGLAGTIFQQLLNNPLASPDFVGVSSGAGLTAVAAITVLHVSGGSISALAFVGAVVSAVLIYLLAWKDGITGYRFILIGIGVSAFFTSLTGYVLSRSELYEARSAMTWLTGSVGQAGAGEIRVLVITVLVAAPVACWLYRHLKVIGLGDDAARALGARVEPLRLAMIGVSVVLVAVATAAAGPIMFVALVAGPIASRLLGPATGLLAAGFAGAIVTLTADLVAQHLLPDALPTGVVTGAVGAPYLVWLLVTANRRGVGG